MAKKPAKKTKLPATDPVSDRVATVMLLRQLDQLADDIRKRFRLDKPGETVWRSETDKGVTVVVADGYGGGTVIKAEGNYPVDYLTVCEVDHSDIEKAKRTAERWVGGF